MIKINIKMSYIYDSNLYNPGVSQMIFIIIYEHAWFYSRFY